MNREQLGRIYSKTKGHCWYCGVYLPPFSGWQVDHQDPVSKGGSNEEWNLVPACRMCNSRKSDRDVGEYEEFLIAGLINLIDEAYNFARALDGPDIDEVIGGLDHARSLLHSTMLVFWGDGTRPGDEEYPDELLAAATPTAEIKEVQ